MLLAVGAWLICFTALASSAVINLRQVRLAGVAVCLILCILVMLRPLMFFFGLDRPSPYAWFAMESWDLMADALLLTTVWIVTITITAMSLSGHDMGRRIFPKMRVLPSPQMLVLVVVGLTLLNLACTGYLVSRAGGIPQFVFAVKIGKELKGLFVLREIGTLAVALLIYGFMLSKRSALTGAPGMPKPWVFFALILVNFGVNYLWGNRFNIAIMTLSFGITYHVYIRRLSLAEILIAGLLALSALEGLKQLRNLLVSEVVGRDTGNNFDFWLRISASLHFNQFDAYLLALRDAGVMFDFREGRDAINGLLAWVPRFIWAEKETFQIGGWFRRVYEPTRVNGWPITAMGSWYVNFGYIGIVLGALVSGLVVAMMDTTYRYAPQDPWAATVGIAIPLQVLQGGVNFGFVQSYVLLVVPLFAVATFFRITASRSQMAQPA